ncbi:MAG: hypothetical protein ACJAYN_003072 [Bermanella sp.]|jgi:hypothetical protein
MLQEWIRRQDPSFDKQLRDYLQISLLPTHRRPNKSMDLTIVRKHIPSGLLAFLVGLATVDEVGNKLRMLLEKLCD